MWNTPTTTTATTKAPAPTLKKSTKAERTERSTFPIPPLARVLGHRPETKDESESLLQALFTRDIQEQSNQWATTTLFRLRGRWPRPIFDRRLDACGCSSHRQ
jgi:hypothetical protein